MSPRAQRFVDSRTHEELTCPRCGADQLVLEHRDLEQRFQAKATCPSCGHEWATSTEHLVRPDRFTWKPGELQPVERGGVIDVVDEALDWMDAPDLRYEDGKPLVLDDEPDERD